MARVLTPHQAAFALQSYAKELRGAVRRPFSRRLTVLRREIQDELKRKGVTGGISRSRKVKRGDLQVNVRVKRPRIGGGSLISGGVEARGIVAIQERGGRLDPHTITAGGEGHVLRFTSRGGRYHFARSVRHPGAKVPALPTIGPAVNRMQPGLRVAIQDSLVQTAERVIG